MVTLCNINFNISGGMNTPKPTILFGIKIQFYLILFSFTTTHFTQFFLFYLCFYFI